MTATTPTDLAAAVRIPAAAFDDPTLRTASPVLGADGLPLASLGDRAVVFQLCPSGGGHGWAVKCYPAAVPTLAKRYARVAERVGHGGLPFAVPCRFLEGGLRGRDTAVPVAVLDWVEGVPLDRAIRERADDPVAIRRLFRAWARVATGLRAAEAAHGELSPPNILVVSGTNPIKLVDYDSFHLPGLPPAADAGHPDFRHPAGAEPADRDRFPLLVVATALRAVEVHGRGVLDRYPAGGSLLFTAADFRSPAESPLLRELTGSPDLLLRELAVALTQASTRPAAETPWVDDLCPGPDDEDHPFLVVADDSPPTAPPPRPRPWPRRLITLFAFAGLLLATAAVLKMDAFIGAPHPVDPIPARVEPPPPPPPLPRPGVAGSQFAPAGVTFRKVWATPLTDDRPLLAVLLPGDGETILAQWPDRIVTFDALTGAALATLRGPGVPTEAARAWSFSSGEVWVYGHPLTAPTAWRVRTGAPVKGPIRGVLAPPGSRGGGADWCVFSPGGRYVFAANNAKTDPRSLHPALFQLTQMVTQPEVDFEPDVPARPEVATKQALLSGSYFGGCSARFAGDRVLMTDGTGMLRWSWAWEGRTEVEWLFRMSINPVPDRLPGLSADGALAILWIAPPKATPAYHLIDARTGQPLRELGPEFAHGQTVLTSDGRWLAGVVPGPPAVAQVTDARTGVLLVRTPLTVGTAGIGPIAVSEDGRMIVFHDPGRKELACYTLRGDVPPAPADAPVTPSAVQPPWIKFPEITPLNPVAAPTPMPRASAVDIPVIAPRWTAAAPAALQALARPQAPLYTPDKKSLVLSGGADGTVLTFDAATGAPGPVFSGHKGPGGVDWVGAHMGQVTSAGFNSPPVAWTARTGKKAEDKPFPALPPLPDGARGHAGITWAVSPGGRYTVAARRELEAIPGPLRLQETMGGPLRIAAEWRGMPENIVFPSDLRLFVLDGLGKATWYSFPSGAVESSWEIGDPEAASHTRVLGVSADGKRVVIYGPYDNVKNAVVMLDGQTGKFLAQLNVLDYIPDRGFAMSPDGRIAAMATRSGGTDFVALDRRQTVGRITHPPESVKDYAQARFSPDGTELAVFFRGAKQVAVYPTPSTAGPGIPVLPERWATPVGQGPGSAPFVYDPESRRVALARPEGDTVTILDADTGARAEVAPTGWKWDDGGNLFVLPQGRLGFHGWKMREVAVWDLKAGKRDDPLSLPPVAKGDEQAAVAVWLSPDARYAAQAGTGTRLVERASGKVLVSVDWPAYSAAFTANGGRVVLAAVDGKHRWFDLPSGDPGPAWTIGPATNALKARGLSISADGKRVGSVNRAVGRVPLGPVVYDSTTGAAVRAFGEERAREVPAAVSADGRWTAALHRPRADGTVWLDVFETVEGRLVGQASFPSKTGVPRFFFTSDGRGLVVHEPDQKKVRWFDLTPKTGPAGPPGRAGG